MQRESSVLHLGRDVPDTIPRTPVEVVTALHAALAELRTDHVGISAPEEEAALLQEKTREVGHCVHVIRDIIFPVNAVDPSKAGGGGGGGGGAGAPVSEADSGTRGTPARSSSPAR